MRLTKDPTFISSESQKREGTKRIFKELMGKKRIND